uniref:Variant surface glycoprotein 1125.1154 n=1 Tax=Trypanosoma brucei TaxID=5691 RepID=A0A1J0R6B6_9TRYP|nr:variant surface glycoprotein 1125.1154 [Trypanosoma brucei]
MKQTTAFALLLSLGTAHAADKMGLLKATWQPLCGLTTELGQLPGEALLKTTNYLTTADELYKESLRLQIFGLAGGSGLDADAALTLSAYLASTAAALRVTLQGIELSKLLKTATLAAYAKGRLDEFLNVASTTKEGSNHGCLLGSGNSPATITNALIDTVPCNLAPPEVRPALRQTQTITGNGVSGLRAPTANRGDHQHSSKNCRLFSRGNGEGLGKDANLDATTITWAAGYIHIRADRNDGKVQLADLNKALPTGNGDISAWTQLVQAVADAGSSRAPEDHNETANLEGSETAAAIVARIKENRNDGTLTNAKAAISNLFGAKTASKPNKLLAGAHNFQLAEKTAGHEKGAKLGDISDMGQLEVLLAAVQAKLIKDQARLDKQLQEEKEKQTPKSEDKEKVCNEAKDDKDVCDKLEKQGCVFNKDGKEGEKCTLSENAKKSSKRSRKPRSRERWQNRNHKHHRKQFFCH